MTLAYDAAAEDESPGALGTLFDSSPAPDVQTSAAAETGFVLGLLAVLAVPFSLTAGLSVVLAAVAVVTSIVGLARASRLRFTGSVLASVGLVLALAALAIVALRYAGVDTAVGDDLASPLHDALSALNDLLPKT